MQSASVVIKRCIGSSGRRCIAAAASKPQQNSSTIVDSDACAGNDVNVLESIVNRNPRNLERMAVARKDRGWFCSEPKRRYWHKLYYITTNRHVNAHVEHCSGNTVVSASTMEWAIKKHLYSTNDVVATTAVGRVLARRCLQFGISYVHIDIPQEWMAYEKMKAFLSGLKEEGLILNEPKTILDFRPVVKVNYFPDSF
ncbi:39S ribosomal protein L18, mitochondrial-like [Anneissia japonica]|uniref:39S ribosomal protein L18, mitochondrial-like n=1 Tax=Anneissia japonica TaxID=1529436 RepID=UPI001425607A|nr:39S ribosomal protein L18, mitochondrial-like [Anneissia japonica]